MTLLAIYRNRSAVLLDQLLDRRQTETSTEILSAEERLEDSREQFSRNPWPGVRDGNFDLIGSRGGDGDVMVGSRHETLFDRLGGIVDQVDNDPAEAIWIETDHAVGRSEITLERHPSRKGLFTEDSIQPRVDVDRVTTQYRGAGIIKQSSNELITPNDTPLNS